MKTLRIISKNSLFDQIEIENLIEQHEKEPHLRVLQKPQQRSHHFGSQRSGL